MPKLHVHTAFTLRHDDGELQHFGVGEHDFPTPVAAHWYVKHHTRGPGAASAKVEDSVDNSAAKHEAAQKAAAEHLDRKKAELDEIEAALERRSISLDEREVAHVSRVQAFEARVAEFEAAQAAASKAATESTHQGAAGNQPKHQGGKR
jgi:hypothetical protein